MPTLIQSEDVLYLAVNDIIITYNCKNGKWNINKLPEVIIPTNLSKGQEEVLKERKKEIGSMSLSKSNEYLAASTQNKQVVIYKTNTFEVIHNFVLNRVASKIRFAPNDNLLIADKTGDAFLYKLNENKEPILVLGHLSMLLDVLVTDCGKYIVTSDRDEKIRVSNYPNCYNIQSYCLGHDEFVTNVELFKNFLISASGDGTIRFWDYKMGTQVAVLNSNDYIAEKSIVEKFCNKMDEDKVEVRALPIRCFQIYKQGSGAFLAINLLNVNYLLIFKINIVNNQPVIDFIQNITYESPLLSFSFSEKLFLLTSTEIILHKLQNGKYILVNDDELCKFYNSHKDFFCMSSDEDVSVLYKRKYDNVQEYLERKKLRLENK